MKIFGYELTPLAGLTILTLITLSAGGLYSAYLWATDLKEVVPSALIISVVAGVFFQVVRVSLEYVKKIATEGSKVTSLSESVSGELRTIASDIKNDCVQRLESLKNESRIDFSSERKYWEEITRRVKDNRIGMKATSASNMKLWREDPFYHGIYYNDYFDAMDEAIDENEIGIERIFILDRQEDLKEHREILDEQSIIYIDVKYIFRRDFEEVLASMDKKPLGIPQNFQLKDDFVIFEGDCVAVEDLHPLHKKVLGGSIYIKSGEAAENIYKYYNTFYNRIIKRSNNYTPTLPGYGEEARKTFKEVKAYMRSISDPSLNYEIFAVDSTHLENEVVTWEKSPLYTLWSRLCNEASRHCSFNRIFIINDIDEDIYHNQLDTFSRVLITQQKNLVSPRLLLCKFSRLPEGIQKDLRQNPLDFFLFYNTDKNTPEKVFKIHGYLNIEDLKPDNLITEGLKTYMDSFLKLREFSREVPTTFSFEEMSRFLDEVFIS